MPCRSLNHNQYPSFIVNKQLTRIEICASPRPMRESELRRVADHPESGSTLSTGTASRTVLLAEPFTKPQRAEHLAGDTTGFGMGIFVTRHGMDHCNLHSMILQGQQWGGKLYIHVRDDVPWDPRCRRPVEEQWTSAATESSRKGGAVARMCAR